MATIKREKTTDTATTEQPTNGESTADAPQAPGLAETNQSANSVEDKTDKIKAPDDKNPPAGDAGDKDGDDEMALVAMRRDLSEDGGPDTADVHPDEVANWRVHGWEIHPLADGFEIHDPNS